MYNMPKLADCEGFKGLHSSTTGPCSELKLLTFNRGQTNHAKAIEGAFCDHTVEEHMLDKSFVQFYSQG